MRLTRPPVLGAGTGMEESLCRTQESWRGDRREKGPRGGIAEDTAERLVKNIHIEYKNNRHLNTNN